jgi:hypothetical protein
MNLRGEMSFPVADFLTQAQVPFLIATGYNSASLPERFSGVPRVEKPFDVGQVMAAIPRCWAELLRIDSCSFGLSLSKAAPSPY